MAEQIKNQDKVRQLILNSKDEVIQEKLLKMNVFGDVDIKVAKKYMKDGNQLQVWLDRADGTMKIVTVRNLFTPQKDESN